MKYIALIILLFLANKLTAQEDSIVKQVVSEVKKDSLIKFVSKPENDGYDKIKLETGDSIIVNIIAETQTEVAFKYPLNTMINKAPYTKVKEIIYKDGKTRAFRNNVPVSGVGAEADNLWRIVVLTYDEGEVSGLKEIGPISAKAEGKSLKTKIDILEKNVNVNLKKSALRMNATKVLVKKKNIEQSYGETPMVEIIGIAYGIE